MNRLIDKLLDPFRRYGLFLMFLFFVTTITDILPLMNLNDYWHCMEVIMGSFLLTYILVLFVTLFKNKSIRRLFQYIVLGCFLLYAVVNSYCYFFLDNANIVDISIIIANSNIAEAKEYLSHAISFPYLLTLVIVMCLLIFLVRKIIDKQYLLSRMVGCSGLLVVIISSVFTFKFPLNLVETSFGRIILSVKSLMDAPPEFADFLTYPKIKEKNQIHPENVVIIIGESFAKHHSSLYGYEKNTNPLLGSLKDLYVFKNVTSTAVKTIDSFKSFMSTYSPKRHDSDMWYRMTTIPEVFNTVGYQTVWLSNQNRTGFYDNIPSKYSELCQKSSFVNEEEGVLPYDGVLIDAVAQEINSGEKKCFFIHLMGQHIAYNSRYPLQYQHFQVDDYSEFPEHQRFNRSCYDNATVYNDYVVHSIIQKFIETDAIVFYFSDHGQDIYDTDVNYCGHGRTSLESLKLSSQIPFMVYATPLFVENNSALINRIECSMDKEYSIDDIIFSLMDVAGYHFMENDDVDKFSLF